MGDTFAFGGSATNTQAFSQIGNGQVKDGADIGDANDLFIHGSLEVEGTFYLTGGSAAIVNADVAEVLLTEKGRQHQLCKSDPNCVVSQEYVKDELDFGDLVCINPRIGQTIERCTEANSRLAVGFVSETAVIKMGNTDSVGYPIGVAGIALAHVTNEGGDINPGDLLVSASRSGYAMKNNNPHVGTVVGKAYDFCYEAECKIPVFIVLMDGAGDSDEKVESIATSTEPTTGSFADRFFKNIFSRIANWLASTANGIATIITEKLTTKELCVSDGSGAETCVTKQQLDTLIGGVGATSNALPQEDLNSSSAPSSTETDTGGDAEAPVININGNNPSYIAIGAAYSDNGATASDNVDTNLGVYAIVNGVDVGDISNISLDTATSSEHEIIYYAVDQAGNRGEATRRVIVGDGVSSEGTDGTAGSTEPVAAETVAPTDTTSPIIVLVGSDIVEVVSGTTYIDPGATATDEVDGDLSAHIVVNTSAVNTALAGSYTVTYNVSDSAGNAAVEVVRTVNVIEEIPAEPVSEPPPQE